MHRDKKLRFAAAAMLVSLLLLTTQSARPLGEHRRPKYGSAAVRLYDAREHVRHMAAPDFWALMPYYLPQPDDRSCSTASVAMLVNALRADRALAADQELATPRTVMEKVAPEIWKDKVAPGANGVTLADLRWIIPRVLDAYGLPPARIEIVPFPENTATARVRLRELLVENERSDRDFILANFLQSELTGDPGGAIGHIAPIAAYDAQRGRVLLFDPNRQWYEPYWVSDDTLLAAMTTPDPASGQARGLIRVVVER